MGFSGRLVVGFAALGPIRRRRGLVLALVVWIPGLRRRIYSNERQRAVLATELVADKNEMRCLIG